MTQTGAALAPAPAPGPDYAKMRAYQLKAECKKRGMSQDGSKDELIARLHGGDPPKAAPKPAAPAAEPSPQPFEGLVSPQDTAGEAAQMAAQMRARLRAKKRQDKHPDPDPGADVEVEGLTDCTPIALHERVRNASTKNHCFAWHFSRFQCFDPKFCMLTAAGPN